MDRVIDRVIDRLLTCPIDSFGDGRHRLTGSQVALVEVLRTNTTLQDITGRFEPREHYKEQRSRHPEEVIPTIATIENAGSPVALLASRDHVNELWKAIAQLQRS